MSYYACATSASSFYSSRNVSSAPFWSKYFVDEKTFLGLDVICIQSHVSVDQIRQPCCQPHPLEKEPRLLSPGSRRRYLQRWKRWVLKKLSLRDSVAGEPTCHQTGLFTCFQVSANTDSSMSGYLQMSKSDKKQGKRLWFVIKDKVLYTYAASEVQPDENKLRYN